MSIWQWALMGMAVAALDERVENLVRLAAHKPWTISAQLRLLFGFVTIISVIGFGMLWNL